MGPILGGQGRWSHDCAVDRLVHHSGVLVQTGKGIGDNEIGRIALNGILYFPAVGSKTTS